MLFLLLHNRDPIEPPVSYPIFDAIDSVPKIIFQCNREVVLEREFNRNEIHAHNNVNTVGSTVIQYGLLDSILVILLTTPFNHEILERFELVPDRFLL